MRASLFVSARSSDGRGDKSRRRPGLFVVASWLQRTERRCEIERGRGDEPSRKRLAGDGWASARGPHIYEVLEKMEMKIKFIITLVMIDE